ncbi:Co2+/Mg2+ efflux protein ApaG [Rasiella rasia]|uniref:Co2+/Mg2+ efflux protein ApaG n=1 Tax=Rasiella rasia TaxID=2744027 RepID=A0A6G6GPF5_9FLAO|nr:Co2+/Mg2+ efflux protein ApaG [Rasiella rasia]QIE60428.1 Co2+/Mg2+ efflux protein ApaG [Rasiella rasia]
MVQQVTKGIKISVASRFQGVIDYSLKHGYAFSYTITIENQSKDIVQLISRKWEIKDALNNTEYVEGDGVVGLQPILQPGEAHTYSSGCILQAPVGSMQGSYKMMNFTTGDFFSVIIPVFKLNAAFAMN